MSQSGQSQWYGFHTKVSESMSHFAYPHKTPFIIKLWNGFYCDFFYSTNLWCDAQIKWNVLGVGLFKIIFWVLLEIKRDVNRVDRRSSNRSISLQLISIRSFLSQFLLEWNDKPSFTRLWHDPMENKVNFIILISWAFDSFFFVKQNFFFK